VCDSKNIFCLILVFAFFILNTNEVRASDNYQTFTFEKNKLTTEKLSGYDIIHYEDLELSQTVGAPQLPVKIVRLSLPPRKDIASISITDMESEYLEGKYNLFPVQPPQILSNPDIQFINPDIDIYSSPNLFPQEIIKIDRKGYFSGNNIGAFRIYPVQYHPVEKKLKFISKIEVKITYKESERMPRVYKSSPYSDHIQQKVLKSIVKDPHSIIQPSMKIKQGSTTLPTDEHIYIIITSDALVNHFQLLADWKLKKGLSAKIVTTSWIYSHYSGTDSQEKIRNFIVDAYQSWGTLWVLLGGDTNIIPARYTFAMDCEWGGSSDENDIPCDLYFADLDGNWNTDGDDIYGEVADSIDMYPDLFVGRAPVGNGTEADAFVNKILTYEKTPSNDYILDMLFLAEILWFVPYTNSGEEKDYIDSLYVPDRFDPITKLYEALGNENYTSAMNALNEGQNIINHNGHAWYTVMSVGDGTLYRSDMDNLINGPKYSILFSIGCWPAAFDYDCIAEHFITNPNGGGVAFIGNSRYGWASPGNPLFGYSNRFDQQFFKHLFIDNIYHIGSSLSAAKSVYIPFAAQENVYRWCEYEINLLGDPEMPIWTNIPQTLTVNFPQELPVGDSYCQITVTDGNNPVDGALICLMQDTVLYQTAITGLDGCVNFDIFTSDPVNEIQLTVTAQNFIPYENTISLSTDEPYVAVLSYSTNGSTDGFVIPGDLVVMNICFKNFGSDTANGVNAILISETGDIIVEDSTEFVGDILPDDSIFVESAFTFQADTGLVNGDVRYLTLEISDNLLNTWTDLTVVTAATPDISYFSHQLSDSLFGDGDGFAEPGETVNIELTIQNTGLDTAQNVTVTLSTSSPYIFFSDSIINFGNILSFGYQLYSIEIEIDTNCPEPSFPQIDLLIETEDGYEFEDSFYIAVGEFGIHDDMENGDGNWTHSGSPDLWHLTSNRKHSGTYSWYCGNEGQYEYDNNMQNSLESIPIVIGQNAELSFWCWYLFPNYGMDGFYVEINDGSGWLELDFIGSGGALGTLPTGNDWLEYTYNLSQYPPGSTITLRFHFQSDDSEVNEGVYIDDITIHRFEEEGGLEIVSSDKGLLTEYMLYQNYPNPFNPVTTIRYELPEQSYVTIVTYDILGREVKELVNGIVVSGIHRVVWDGTDSFGKSVGAGVYLYQIKAGDFVQTRKMLLLK